MKRLLGLAAGLAFLGMPAFAAVTPNSVVLPQGWTANLALDLTTTTTTTFATGAANGSKVLSIICTSTDPTLAHTILVYHNVSSVNYLVAAVNIPVSAGDVPGTPPVQLITNTNIPGPITGNGNRYLSLGSGDTISLQLAVAPTSGDQVTCTGEQVNF